MKKEMFIGAIVLLATSSASAESALELFHLPPDSVPGNETFYFPSTGTPEYQGTWESEAGSQTRFTHFDTDQVLVVGVLIADISQHGLDETAADGALSGYVESRATTMNALNFDTSRLEVDARPAMISVIEHPAPQVPVAITYSVTIFSEAGLWEWYVQEIPNITQVDARQLFREGVSMIRFEETR